MSNSTSSDDNTQDEKLEDEMGLDPSEQEEPNSKVYPNAVVRIEKLQLSIESIQKAVYGRKTIVLAPEFQRNNVWKHKQQCELVESILMGLPIPAFYFFEDEKGIWQVVDGKQRITAILAFLNNEFPLKDLKVLHNPDFEGKRFKDLSPKLQGIFEYYQLFCFIIQPPTSERIKYDIFDRVNRGGTSLNNQEMRNALYQGLSTELLKELAECDEFKQTIGNASSKSLSKRMKDRYLILRLIAFYLRNKQILTYSGDREEFLADCMKHINKEMADADISQLKDVFKQAMARIGRVVGTSAFRFNSKDNGNTRPINMLLFEALGYIFMAAEEHNIDVGSINFSQWKDALEKSELFNGRIDTKERMEQRYQLIITESQRYDNTLRH